LLVAIIIILEMLDVGRKSGQSFWWWCWCCRNKGCVVSCDNGQKIGYNDEQWYSKQLGEIWLIYKRH